MQQIKRLIRWAFAVAAGFALVGAAHAQLRSIPEAAKRGDIRHLQGMVVEISGRLERLAPGAQIRDAANRVVVPAALPPGAPAKYVLDAEGLVREIWILTPEEAAQR